MRRRTFLLALAGAATACGAPAAPLESRRRELMPAWGDAFDALPDVFVVVRPRALRADRTYGALFSTLLRAAEARGLARGATMTDAVSGATELVIGLGGGDDALFVARGVPASLDPATVKDEQGRPLFRLVSERGRVAEHAIVDPRGAAAGSLFVLPERTWVAATGEARARARQAFQTPMNRPAPELAPKALLAIRLGGEAARRFDRSPRLSLVTQRMTSATLALEPGRDGLVLSLHYLDDDAAARGELHAKRLVADLAATERFAWLKSATVRYEGVVVRVRADVPARLLEDLPGASFSDLAG